MKQKTNTRSEDDGLEKNIDCVVSEFFPVNDFTMNDLIYDGTTINLKKKQ